MKTKIGVALSSILSGLGVKLATTTQKIVEIVLPEPEMTSSKICICDKLPWAHSPDAHQKIITMTRIVHPYFNLGILLVAVGVTILISLIVWKCRK